MNLEAVVVDASALVDLMVPTDRADVVAKTIEGRALHAPAHVDAELLSAFGRLQRADVLSEQDVTELLDILESMPVVRHGLPDLLELAWGHRHDTRLTDALYLALAERLGLGVVTTDARLTRAGSASSLILPLNA
ncbi:type II toxin-antitoxin system VapC family toxin [Jiangella sp. DSM 45060]|uniref:type II toxin-antitoxin system VapC family toxin n=1 Tax=Jiangella sp. DSM 45060 TaxID=1798224 RepID=UPI00087C3769|nr:type II toxin-antitoxin system VapC family toxin [Jiangella sp. DSM 45060]SDT58221.1 Predicted nucleic acid-binding protein, contains PIN domain [Jiangella sp. DSM 45060]